MNDKLGLVNLNPALPEEDRAEDEEVVDVVRDGLVRPSRLSLVEWSPVFDLLDEDDDLTLCAILSPVGNRCKLSCPTDSDVPSLADVDGVDVVVWLLLSLLLPLPPPLLLLMMLLSDMEDWECVLCCERDVARATLVITSTWLPRCVW